MILFFENSIDYIQTHISFKTNLLSKMKKENLKITAL